jgi:hypothetical protein
LFLKHSGRKNKTDLRRVTIGLRDGILAADGHDVARLYGSIHD